MRNDVGASALPTGPSQAEPEVSALRASVPSAHLADRVEAAVWPQRTRELNREVALAVGWVRQAPSEGRRSSNPKWFHPDDCCDGRVVMDSLHGTDVWREPLDYLGSLDAAATLVPSNWVIASLESWPQRDRGSVRLREVKDFEEAGGYGFGYNEACGAARSSSRTATLALCAAALRARASQAMETGTVKTEGLSAQHDSVVRQDAPPLSGDACPCCAGEGDDNG